MADVLSQSQIDALLNSMQNGGEPDSASEEPKKLRKVIENMTFTVLRSIQRIN